MKKLLIAITFVLTCSLFYTSIGRSEIVVATSLKTKVRVVSRDELKSIFQQNTRFWDSGEKITLVLLPVDNPLHQQFIRSVLLTSPERYQRNLNKSLNQGSASNVIVVSNLTEMLKVVSTVENSIGYFSDDVLITYGSRDNVKIITITD